MPIDSCADLQMIPSQIVWDLEKNSPSLWEAIQDIEPNIQSHVTQLRKNIPAQIQPHVFNQGFVTRPHGHFRALYFDLYHPNSPYPPGTGCLALKGTEAVADNFSALLNKMQQLTSIYQWSITHPWGPGAGRLDTVMGTLLERFALWEKKIPGCVLLSEALAEANQAVMAQSCYLKAYGKLACLPIPLLVHKFDNSVTKRVLRTLKKYTPTVALDL